MYLILVAHLQPFFCSGKKELSDATHHMADKSASSSSSSSDRDYKNQSRHNKRLRSRVSIHLPEPSVIGRQSSEFVKHLFRLKTTLKRTDVVDPDILQSYRSEIAIHMLELWVTKSDKYLSNDDDVTLLCTDAIQMAKRRHEEKASSSS